MIIYIHTVRHILQLIYIPLRWLSPAKALDYMWTLLGAEEGSGLWLRVYDLMTKIQPVLQLK